MVTTEEASNLVELFAGKNRLRLYYEEFLELVLPSDSLLRSRASQRDSYPCDPLTQSAEYALARVIQAEIDGLTRLSSCWSNLTSRYDYNVFDAFRAIDRERDGYITPENLSRFLKYADYPWKLNDAELFISRLDSDRDGRLSYSEFVDGLVPDFATRLGRRSTATYYPYSEKKPSYYRRPESPAPRTEYKSRYYGRLSSAERYSPASYESPAKREEPIADPYKTYYSPYSKSFYEPSTAPISASAYIPKKLEYVSAISPSKKRQAATELVSALEEQLTFEKKHERAKEALALETEFNLMDGFKLFDETAKGYVTLTEFCDGLHDLDISAPYSDISLLFNRYNKYEDGKLRYSDFCLMMTPKRAEYEKMLISRPPYLLQPPSVSYFIAKIRTMFREVLETALQREQRLEDIRRRLRRSLHFNAYDAFDSLDVMGKGQVSISAVSSKNARKECS